MLKEARQQARESLKGEWQQHIEDFVNLKRSFLSDHSDRANSLLFKADFNKFKDVNSMFAAGMIQAEEYYHYDHKEKQAFENSIATGDIRYLEQYIDNEAGANQAVIAEQKRFIDEKFELADNMYNLIEERDKYFNSSVEDRNAKANDIFWSADGADSPFIIQI